jgi:putative transposase
MIEKIRGSHEFAATYRSPRIWLALRRAGLRCGRKRIERIMRENNLHGAFLRTGWKGGSTTHNPRHTAAPDLVERDFTASEPNRLWVADLTRVPTGEGVLWLASVRDAFLQPRGRLEERSPGRYRPGAHRPGVRAVVS